MLGSIVTALVVGPQQIQPGLTLKLAPPIATPIEHRLHAKFYTEVGSFEFSQNVVDRYEDYGPKGFVRTRYCIRLATDEKIESRVEVANGSSVPELAHSVVMSLTSALPVLQSNVISARGEDLPEDRESWQFPSPLEFGTFFDLVFPTEAIAKESTWSVTQRPTNFGPREITYKIDSLEKDRVTIRATIAESKGIQLVFPYVFTVDARTGIIQSASGSICFNCELGWIAMSFEEQLVTRPKPAFSRKPNSQ